MGERDVGNRWRGEREGVSVTISDIVVRTE